MLNVSMKEAEMIKAIESYKDIQEALAEARKREKYLKDKILAWMDGDMLKAGSYTVTLKTTKARNLDTVTLKKELPELWNEYGKDTERKSLVIV